MKQRPILFSAPMVKALLDDQKTQTRRPVRLPAWFRDEYASFGAHEIQKEIDCPYGVPGDRLWVRETWAPVDRMGSGVEREEAVEIGYRADLTAVSHEHENVHSLDTTHWNWDAVRWRPSIFMPRWASRITLDVTQIRVQRLQSITDEDARAEGVQADAESLRALSHLRGADAVRAVPSRLLTARDHFAALWDSINGTRAPWSSNPWIWVVSFKRVT